jgi:lipopolysaccharide transport system permease protein
MSSAQAMTVVATKPNEHVTVIAPAKSVWSVNFAELVEYRDLFWFWTWRSIRVRYAQSALGVGWAIIQPLFSMLVFTVIFGNLAKIQSDGVPYAVFSLAGLVIWSYFADSVNESTNSLIQNANMIGKIYFPRLILPLSSVAAKLVDLAISFTLLFALMVWFQIVPRWEAVFIPVLILIAMISAAAAGMWLTALAIQYRDVKHGSTFVVQLLMYAAPVVYPASLIPEKWRLLYALNPMVGVIEGMRASLLGTREMPWDLILVGGVTAPIMFVASIVYFTSKERLFADVA